MEIRDGTPRIPPVESFEGEVADLLGIATPAADGSPLRLLATLAHDPPLLRRVLAMGGMFLGGPLPARERELVILRVSALEGCAYEWGHHVHDGRTAGLAEAEIAALGGETGVWSADDRALIAFTDELVGSGTVGDEAWAALAARFDDAQLLELVSMIGYYRMLAGVLRTVRIAPDPGLVPPPSQTPGNAWL